MKGVPTGTQQSCSRRVTSQVQFTLFLLLLLTYETKLSLWDETGNGEISHLRKIQLNCFQLHVQPKRSWTQWLFSTYGCSLSQTLLQSSSDVLTDGKAISSPGISPICWPTCQQPVSVKYRYIPCFPRRKNKQKQEKQIRAIELPQWKG